MRADRVPASLASYVVDQRYDAYGEVDHEVWRRVIGGIAERLRTTAHPSYAAGFAKTGMARDRIPRIDAMHDHLAALGWGAACVDGFIPPRAFQAFQAHRILPIARDVRSLSHLGYTPAPDVLHEAAGHAPMLVDPEYADFAQRIGAMGMRCFTLPSDDESFFAIRALSIDKEDASSAPDVLAAAEARVARAMRRDLPVSEAGRLARLYWWTIEYGLVGTPRDYTMYGAGLLSSLEESETCHRASVPKVPLHAACVDVPYDITRPQPQLFVTPSFSALGPVLDEVMATMAFRRGGLAGVETAIASGEVASIRFAGGAVLSGRVRALRGTDQIVLTVAGPLGVRRDARDTDRVIGRTAETLSVVLEADGATVLRASGEALRVATANGPIVSCHPYLEPDA